MASKKIEMNEKASSGYNQLYPVTDASIVIFGDNPRVDTKLDSIYGKVDSVTVSIGTLSSKADGMVILAKDVIVAAAAWESDSTYEDYPYVALIPMQGVHKKYIPDVYFNMEDSMSGNFAPIATTKDPASGSEVGFVRIYAKEIPNGTTTIPSIKCIVNVDDIEKDPILLQSISIETYPTKLEYTEGDALDLTGLTIRAFYDNGDSEIVTGWVSDPLPGTILSTVGTTTVTIYYTQVS